MNTIVPDTTQNPLLEELAHENVAPVEKENTGARILRKRFASDIITTIDKKKVDQYMTDMNTILQARNIVNTVVTPLQTLLDSIDKSIMLTESIIAHYDKGKGGNVNEQKEVEFTIKKLFPAFTGDKANIFTSDAPAKLTTEFTISLIKKFLSRKEDAGVTRWLNVLEANQDAFAVKYSLASDTYGDTPSLVSFLKALKYELVEYKRSVELLPVNDDAQGIVKVECGQRLKEQKKNGYIKLPYYQDTLQQMEALSRPGKVGKVVLKGHPGTGKTSIFTYKGEVEKRPYRIISMHQYINFYELIVQNTNLSPTKNQLEFFSEVLGDYESLTGKELIERLTSLFDANKNSYPHGFTLIDFVNTIFDINRFIKDGDKNTKKLSQEDMADPEKIKGYVIRMLKYWKDEKVYKLLLSKKELIKGEILDAIDKGENVVLDEVDKVQEKEIEGLLAFLDLTTGKYHQIQGMEEKMFIPEWFGVYATSNDKYKPSGPLGRRFNSLELEYLDKENLTLYIMARISNPDLTTPFTDNEINQIIKAITIIIDNKDEEKFKALDFSVRMVDTFLSNFLSHRHHIVEKKVFNNPKSYILDALYNAFHAQTEDVYGTISQNSEVEEQKDHMLTTIESAAKELEEDSSSVSPGRKLNKAKTGLAEAFIDKLGYNNALLDIAVTEKQKKYAEEHGSPRVVDFGQELGSIISLYDHTLKKFVPTKSDEIITPYSEDISIDKKEYSFIYSKEKKTLIIETQKGTLHPKKTTLICQRLAANKQQNCFIVFGGEEVGDKFVSIDSNGTEKIEDLSLYMKEVNGAYGSSYTLDHVWFGSKNRLVWIAHRDTGKGKEYSLFNQSKLPIKLPSAMDIKLYEDQKLILSHSQDTLSLIPLANAQDEKWSFPYADDIKEDSPYIETEIKDLSSTQARINDASFDTTMRYILVGITGENDSKHIVPIKL